MHSGIQPSIESLPPLVSVRPMLMLTGFLGAGKTTLLRAILDELTHREYLADVILNDRENAYLDKETLKNHTANVEALTGSCLCCDGIDGLCDLILKASQSLHNVLLIELNGTADPVPLLETFTLLESKFHLRPRWQVCVLHARDFGKRGRFNDLEALQLETASHYYISRTASLTGQEELKLEQAVRSINPRASRTNASAIADSLSQAIRQNRRHTLAQKGKTLSHFALNRLAPATPLASDDRHQLAHEFTGCSITIPHAVEPTRVVRWLESLPCDVIRAKALVELTSDSVCRFLYERVGQEVSPYPLTIRAISKAPCSGLFIGANLHPNEILQLTQQMLHPNCHFQKQ